MHLKRGLWLAVIIISLLLYFLIGRSVSGGIQPSLPADVWIPLWPPAIIPYLLGNVLFIALPVWAALKIKPGHFEAYALSILLATFVSYAIYITVPTYVARPAIESQDIFSQAISILYQTDQPYNAAPSGHTFYTLISFLYLRRWKARWLPAWLAFSAAIIASTLLTKQHYILDVLSGLVLGYLAYLASVWAQKRWKPRFASQ